MGTLPRGHHIRQLEADDFAHPETTTGRQSEDHQILSGVDGPPLPFEIGDLRPGKNLGLVYGGHGNHGTR